MFAPTATSITQAQAISLLDGDVCIWCEEAPKAATSHLCEECRKQDPDGVLRRAVPLHAVAPRP